MADEEHGRLFAVSQTTMGDELAATPSTGDTTLTLTDVSDFDETGGTCLIDGNLYAYTVPDFDLQTIAISPGAIGTPGTGDRVDIWDANTSRPVVAYSGLVQLDGQTDGDCIEADLDHSLVPLLGKSIGLEGRSVTLTADGGDYRVTAVHGKEASHDDLTYLPGGVSTRADSTGAGIDILGPTDNPAGGIINFYTGAPAETGPGSINPLISASIPMLRIRSSQDGSNQATLTLGPFGSTLDTDLSLSGSADLLVFGGNITAASGDITAATGDVTANGSLVTPNAPTTTNAANCRIGGAGILNLVTSLTEHKLKAKPLTAEDVRPLLDIDPQSWFDRGEHEANGKYEGLRRIPGALAEDVAEHLPLLADYDDQGDLQGVHNDRVGWLLIPLVRDLMARIEALEAERR